MINILGVHTIFNKLITIYHLLPYPTTVSAITLQYIEKTTVVMFMLNVAVNKYILRKNLSPWLNFFLIAKRKITKKSVSIFYFGSLNPRLDTPLSSII